jgi:hypothetical protein
MPLEHPDFRTEFLDGLIEALQVQIYTTVHSLQSALQAFRLSKPEWVMLTIDRNKLEWT